MLQVVQDVVQSHVDRIIHRLICSVSKLQEVQQGGWYVLQMAQHQPLKGFHDHRRQGDGPEIIQTCDEGLLGDWNYGGEFEAGGDFTQFQKLVEDRCQLFGH